MMSQERFGPYTLIDRIGQGGQSTVYRALDPQGRTVALKILNKALLNDDEQRRRFLMEPRQQPVHPNIVRILDPGGECPPERAGELSNGRSVPYFATEFIEGRSLLQMMRDANGRPVRIAPRDLYPVLRDIAAALDAVHQLGIIHRDIKPGNILLRAVDRRAFLADFGIAKSSVTSNMTMTTSNRPGSATYMAPEQADVRLGAMGPASDVYSLGVTAYEALTSRPPFIAPVDVAVMYKHINEPPIDIVRLAPDVPRTVAAVVMRALNKAPAQRYPTASAFANAYFEALTAAPPPVTAPIPAAPVPGRRRGWVIPVIALFALMAIGAIGVAALSAGRPTPPPPPTASVDLKETTRPTIAVATVTRAAIPTPPISPSPVPAATSTLDPYAPIATSTLAPEVVPTERPTQAPPVASITPATPGTPVSSANVKLEAIARGGYEQWGRPPSPTRCDDIRNDRGLGFRFKAQVRVTIQGGSAAEGLSAGFIDINNQPVTACIDGFGPSLLPTIPAGQARDFVILAYLQTKSIRRLFIGGPGGIVADQCFDGEIPVSCR